MFLKAVYNTNEVAGSFWRPHDYMAHVPNAKVTGTVSGSFSSEAATVSISEAGLRMAASNARPSIQAIPANISANNDKELKSFKRYIYNGAEGTVKLTDIAV